MCPRWRRSCAQQPSLWLLGLSICCCLALLVPLLLYSTPSQLLGAAPAFGCDPNGRVFVDTGRHFVPSRWSSAYTLGVTMGFGQLTYTAAKSTDEAWNLVVARGGQLLGGLLVYRTFRKPVGLALSQHRAPYRTALALQYAPVSVDSFWQYSREALRQDRHKYFGMFASIMLIISTIFVLVAPTWLSAMTGYRAVMRAMFPWEGGIYVPSEKLSYCWTVLQGAARVGLRNKICAPVGGDLSDAVADYMLFLENTRSSKTLTTEQCDQSACTTWISLNVSSEFTLNGQTHHLDPPSLQFLSSTSYLYPETADLIDTSMFAYNGHIATSRDLQRIGICQAQDQYAWGFSFLLAFAFVVATCLWLIALWFLEYGMKCIKEDDDLMRIWGPYKTAVAITKVLEEDLQRDVYQLTDSEVREELVARRRKMKGIPLLPDKHAPSKPEVSPSST